MGAITFEIGEAFKAQFGRQANDFQFDPVPASPTTAKLGSRYIAKDAQGRDYKMPVKLGGYDLPYPVVRVNGYNDIVETKVASVDGTIKEFISASDWSIIITGFMLNDIGAYPEEQMEQILALIQRREALEIRSVITDMILTTPERKGYDKAVIYAWDFPEARGVENWRAYQLVLKSDKPFDAYID